MTYILPSLQSLPPPVIFEHNETLHAIPLPPLATFLTALHRPEHLVRLHDILDRYRTPKSYHRIDVRVVESSELPPGSPLQGCPAGQSGLAAVNGDARRKEMEDERRKGEPIILPEGVSKERHLSSKTKTDVKPTAPRPDGAIDADPSFNRPDIPLEAGPSRPTSPIISPPPISSPEVFDRDIGPIDPQLIFTRSNPLPKPHKPHRIRELRLDLHTLDAAALFALETWRRDVLELPKLDMQHPDSIWYHDPDSTPPPETILAKKKLRRPKKKKVDDVRIAGEDGEGEGKAEYDALVSALGNETGHGEKVESMGEVLDAAAILRVLEAFDTHPIRDDNLLDIPMEEADTRSPSPDVILDDLFDEREDMDPDFVPPASPPPGSHRPTRTRNSLPNVGSSGVKMPKGRPRTSVPLASFQDHHCDGEVIFGDLPTTGVVARPGMEIGVPPGPREAYGLGDAGAGLVPRKKRKARMVVVELPKRNRRMQRKEGRNEKFSTDADRVGERNSEVAIGDLEEEAEILDELLGEQDRQADSDQEEWGFLKNV